ncbi:hypothetical protein [Agromyces sp. LHK192]|uniref:hypothetical protein n=1 Tax=Agromyces sp. LHK192 TaxID=2498704 RepID=UPI000FDA60C7|nr:hypothetical protein [Agromyces sp. LHK192]
MDPTAATMLWAVITTVCVLALAFALLFARPIYLMIAVLVVVPALMIALGRQRSETRDADEDPAGTQC